MSDDTQVTSDEKDKLMSNLKTLRIIRFPLPPETFCLVNSYRTAKEIWEGLKELYFGDVNLTHSVQTSLLSKFGSFEQMSNETLEKTINRFNHLFICMLKHK